MANNRLPIERLSLGALALVAGPLAMTTVRGQMAIEAAVFGAGGGASAGGVFTLGDTLGQTAADLRSASDEQLAEGFWNVLPALHLHRPPTPENDVVHRPPGSPAKFSATSLLGNDFDPDGDPLTLIGVDLTSTLAGSVRLIGPWIYYFPPAGPDVADSFQYTVADPSGLTARGSVNILVGALAPAPAQNILGLELLPNGHRRISFAAVPGLTYHVDASSDLGVWTRLGAATASALGEFVWEDADAESFPVRFYRSTWP